MQQPYWILSKGLFEFFFTGHKVCLIFTKFGTDDLQTKPHKSYQMDYWFSKSFVQFSQSESAVKLPNRKWGHISFALNKQKLLFFHLISIDVFLLTKVIIVSGDTSRDPEMIFRSEMIFRPSFTKVIRCIFEFVHYNQIKGKQPKQDVSSYLSCTKSLVNWHKTSYQCLQLPSRHLQTLPCWTAWTPQPFNYCIIIIIVIIIIYLGGCIITSLTEHI